MHQDFKTRLWSGGDFQTAQEIAELFGKESTAWITQLKEWKDQHEIFSIDSEDGVELFPVFAFDSTSDFRPYKAVAPVLRIFGDHLSKWAIASWCIGLNSYLDDQYPKDLLTSDADWVIEAAQDLVNEIGLQSRGTSR